MNYTQNYLDSQSEPVDHNMLMLTQIESEINQGNLGEAVKIYKIACEGYENLKNNKTSPWQTCKLKPDEIESELTRIGAGLVLLNEFYKDSSTNKGN